MFGKHEATFLLNVAPFATDASGINNVFRYLLGTSTPTDCAAFQSAGTLRGGTSSFRLSVRFFLVYYSPLKASS